MKTLYLINTTKYPYHKILVEDFNAVCPGEVTDLAKVSNYGSTYGSIKEYSPDAIIAFDLAGHDFRTGNGTLSLNGIYCRIANILFQKLSVYGSDVKLRQNLSAFMYIPESEDVAEAYKSCPEVPNIYNLPKIMYKATDEKDREYNRRQIAKWWEEFKVEAWLDHADGI